MLSDKQKHEFETLGFLCLKQLIPPDEMRAYIDAFDETMVKANGGQPWSGAPKGQQVVPFYKHNPAVYHGGFGIGWLYILFFSESSIF